MAVFNYYALNEDVLIGTQMQTDWIPQINSHIFISHSHMDEKGVITLAGWLYDTFCLQPDSYCNYEIRNYSTSHIHMMLSTALIQMIDKLECLFFYNTPKSISSANRVSKTESPWIYSEITMSQLLRQNIPYRRRIEDARMFSKVGSKNEQLIIEYELDLKHLNPIDTNTLKAWETCVQTKEVALDEITGILFN